MREPGTTEGTTGDKIQTQTQVEHQRERCKEVLREDTASESDIDGKKK